MLKIRKLRTAKEWSQMELSRRSGVSQSFINDLEAGNKQPTITTLRKLADALGVSVADLLDEEQQSA
ncbi:helix-turn-helix domain-containing protein [Brevibacillus aydinogluensis]|uniref:HTH cro/C1-type domain-containing protein n=1 Tax=Brevibacillus aydinogluensis TaxID=927786 RepID=A0AA48M7L2_9BACL|nr:helix-turn-helix transcriptional regulator [Brevibacillus aydinogluensis]CAJ1000979.1 HTH cro/C1-type domain-containing protein [Brevibacillus aydinogluensis]